MNPENGNTNHFESSPFLLGDFEVLPDRNVIRKNNVELSLEPRLMHVLVYLAARTGQVVPRRQLKEAVWQDPLMGDDSLNRAISDLRRLLDDDRDTPRYIETIRKVGYRMVGPVSGPDTVAVGRRRLRGPVIAAVLVLGLLVVWLIFERRADDTAPAAPAPPVPVTTDPGLEVRPALSPDGSLVAFARKSKEGAVADIYVTTPGASAPLRLTSHPGYENYPAWSPEGDRVAFVRVDSAGTAIVTVPAAGGESTPLYREAGFLRHLDWSRDGRWIVFSHSPRDDGYFHLKKIDILRRNTPAVELTPLARGESSDSWPRFSPSGDRVAFVRTGASGMSDIFCSVSHGGEIRRLTRGQIDVWGLDWLPAGGHIVFSSFTGGPYGLSIVPADGGPIRRLPVLSEWVRYPSVAHDTGRLVFEGRRETQDIMKTSIGPGDAAFPAPEPLVVSNRLDNEPALSPDGKKLVFVSTRGGSRELWLCDADGSLPTQLTTIGGDYVSLPLWSGDGRYVAFAVAGVETAVYVIATAGGAPRRITPPGQNAMPCSWSADGSRVYFAGETGGEWQIWSAAPDGGRATQVTTDGGIAAFESPDGNFLYFMRPDVNGIWRRPIDGVDAERVIPDIKASFFRFWSVAGAGIYYATPEEDLSPVFLKRWSGGEPLEVARIPSYPSARFSVAPDGGTLLFVRCELFDIDLFLLDNILAW